MSITVFPGPFGPMDEKTAPAPFSLNAGTYTLSMTPVDNPPKGFESVELQYDQSALGNQARGNNWRPLAQVTANSGITSFTVPTGGVTAKFAVRGNVTATISS